MQPQDRGMLTPRECVSIGNERVQSLMREMGLIAIYPKSDVNKRYSDHKIYPYLLANEKNVGLHQEWGILHTFGYGPDFYTW